MFSTNTGMTDMNQTRRITYVALVAAALCILSPLTIPLPFSPVPLSLTILVIYLGVYVLGMKWGTAACLIYILIGLTGIPVFAGFTGGPAKLFGPTGGYIIGYLFVALFSGLFIDRFETRRLLHIPGMVLGTGVCYLLGTAWLAHQASMSFEAALWAGVIPFLPGDVLKIIAALLLGPVLRRAVRTLRS